MAELINLTPDNDGYAAIGATIVASILSDISKLDRFTRLDEDEEPRYDSVRALLTAVVDIAYLFGVDSARNDVVHADGAKLRDALFNRVGGPKRD